MNIEVVEIGDEADMALALIHADCGEEVESRDE